MSTINVFTDGGARGNPGPAAAAFVVKKDKEVIAKGAKYLGVTTNNMAEYAGLLLAIEWLVENKNEIKGCVINFYLDSLLVVNQIKGIYKIKSKSLFIPFNQSINLLNKLDNKVEFLHVTRDKNKEADSLVNVTIDEK